MSELIIYYVARGFGWFVRFLPLTMALWVGRLLGICAYYFSGKNKSQAYANLRMAFALEKSPKELKQITKQMFKNYGQSLVEVFRLPLLTVEKFKEIVKIEGYEHVVDALRRGNGCIFLAMHFGSWELASLSCAMIGHPYKVLVKPQEKHSRLDELLNTYRSCGGFVILSRGIGMRDIIKGLKSNEVVGLVTDQGGKDGVLVPFFARNASMSVGAIRIALKLDVPLCFSLIVRQPHGKHQLIINKPLELIKTDDIEKDVKNNLVKVVQEMERYVRRYPAEYMWFYKIWKYSDQMSVVILHDGKTGHLRQSQTVVKCLSKAGESRGVQLSFQTVAVEYRTPFHRKLSSLLCRVVPPFAFQGRLEVLRFFLSAQCYKELERMKTDCIISTGSSVAALNNFLARENKAKSIVVQKPGIIPVKRFNLVILPEHDIKTHGRFKKMKNVVITQAAPNLVDQEYLQKQTDALLNRYSHLKNSFRTKIGVLIGGDSKNVYISEQQARILIQQLNEVSKEINADILVTTSRRTPASIDQMFLKDLKKQPNCKLLVMPNREDVPEALGGILGLADILVVSGDSISMVSEAVASKKSTIVFSPKDRHLIHKDVNKHRLFLKNLNIKGHILSTEVQHLGRAIYDIAKGKIQTKPIDDNQTVFDAVRKLV